MNLQKAHVKIDSTKVAYTMKEEVRKDVEAKIITAVYAAFLISLHDEFDWGAVRLERLLKRVHGQYEQVYDNNCTIEDIKQVILAETGIDLR